MPNAKPPISASHKALFIGLLLALLLALCSVATLFWSIPLLREQAHQKTTLAQRRHPVWITSLPYNKTPERQAHLRACYLDPRIDLGTVPWNLLCRPTPFVNYAPAPGDQQDGHFNSAQLRDVREIALPKPADVYRIFVVGGSYAYGIGASHNEAALPAFLEQALRAQNPWPGKRVEVWNAAVCGYASTNERLWIECHLVKLEPDLILAVTGINDAHWGDLGADVFELRTYEDAMYFDMLQGAMRIAGVPSFPAEPPALHAGRIAPELVVQRFLQNATQTAALLAARRIPFVVAIQPNLHPRHKQLSPGEKVWLDTMEPAGKMDYVEACLNGMEAALAGQPNLQLAHLRDVYAQRGDPIFTDMYHVGDKGNQLAARQLAEELRRLAPLH